MKFVHAVLLSIIGAVVFGTTMTFAQSIPATAHYTIRGGLIVVLGALWLISRRGPLQRYRSVFLAYFAIAAALTIAYYAADPILAAMRLTDRTPIGSATAKCIQAVIASTVVLIALAGDGLGSLYIRKGRLLLGVGLGLLGMALFIGLTFLPGGPGLKVASMAGGPGALMALVPAVALFALSNAAMEELLFRGALLQRYEPLTGKWGALIATTVVFAAAHVQVNYTSQLLYFLSSVLVLGFLWGLLMQKSKSIWGSILFHAGADVAIILPLYQGMMGS